jgi:hypothetical protein
MVSKPMLQKLKIIIKNEYGRDLSDSEVFEIGNGLVRYFKALKRLNLSKQFANMKKHTNKLILKAFLYLSPKRGRFLTDKYCF